MKKKFLGFSLIEMLIVMSIIIILGSFGAGAFLGFRETALVRENVETLKQEVQLAQHMAMNMKKGDEQYWVYGIGIDLGDISTSGNYRFFKWCSEFRDFGDTLTKSEIIAYDPSEELGAVLGERERPPDEQHVCSGGCTRSCFDYCQRNPYDKDCVVCNPQLPPCSDCGSLQCRDYCQRYQSDPDCLRCFGSIPPPPPPPVDPIKAPRGCEYGCIRECRDYCMKNPSDLWCQQNCSVLPGPGDIIYPPDPIFEKSMRFKVEKDSQNLSTILKPKQAVAQENVKKFFDAYLILNGYLPPGTYGTSCNGAPGGVLVRVPGYEQDRIVDIASDISVLGGSQGAHYVVFEAITGRAFLYDSLGKPINYSGGGGVPLTFNPEKTLDVLIERSRSSKFDVLSVLPISGTVIHHVYSESDEDSSCVTKDQCLSVGGNQYRKYTLQSEIESYR